MNKTFRSVWNARQQTYVAAAETVSAKGKPSSGVQQAATVAALLGGLLGQVAHAQTAPPPNTLPTGGQVTAGQASVGQSGANMVIQQGSDRAAINWQTFNVGKDAQVQFQQPGASSVTLNRVLSADPSQIFGRISANGQVILTNPRGVYFGKDARVDVGGIIATTHGISDADFMADKNRFERNGSTGSVVNDGEIKASLGGYIALLAPEVRNQGAIIAQMGTVALAAGEAIDLHFDSNNRLTSIRVEPSQIQALVDNRYAVQAPGGLIILSAQSMDRLVGGVVKNSGRIEANGLQQQGGRIVLSASHKVENTGSITVNATAAATAADSSPAGKIEISAPEVINSGNISATGAFISTNTGAAPHSAGSVLIQATNVTQTTIGRIDLSAPQQGGTLTMQTTGKVQLQGQVDVSATQDQAGNIPTQGGQIDIAASGDIEITNATLDASGGRGGQIQLRTAAPAQSNNPNPLPDVPNAPSQGHLAIMGSSTLSIRGRSGKGGSATLLGDHIDLLDATQVDATGATGGGTVLVGGDWQGSNGVYQATSVSLGQNAVIDASATDHGDGGKVVLWSDVHKTNSLTTAHGSVLAKGGVLGGNGGQLETSGHVLAVDGIHADASAAAGQSGEWLLDPYNITISSSADSNVSGYTATNTSSNLNVSTLTNALNIGTNVTVQTGASGSEIGDITVNAAISKIGNTDSTLTLKAHNNVVVNNAISSANSKLNINLLADSDKDGAGIVIINSNLSSKGGNIAFGDGSTITFGGVANTQVGGDVYVTGSSAVTWDTGGGNLTVNGQTLIGNTSGLSINSANGAVTFNGSIDSANQYTSVYESAAITWTDAVTAAKSGTGSATGDTYLATITSRLENAIASQTVGYNESWLGGRRVTGIGTDTLWRWVTGPEAAMDGGKGLVFAQQNTSGSNAASGATSVNGYFNNWSTGEPNNWTGLVPGAISSEFESVTQFTGSLGKWNDLNKTSSNLNYYVKETNATPSPLTINAGAGTLAFKGSVGVNKALSDLTITAGSYSVTQSTTFNVSNDVQFNAAITKPPGTNADLAFKAGRHLSFGAQTFIDSTSNKLNLLFQADTDKSGDGFIKYSGPSINTNGGYIQFGIGDTATLNSATVYVGGDVYFDGAAAQSVATEGGTYTAYGETLVANTSGLTIATNGGDVLFKGVLNSANQYTGGYSATALSWIDANTQATGTNSYLATITSRLENSIAALAGGYNTAWLGGRRLSNGTWQWQSGPEAGQAFTYANWASGEPNNCCTNTNGLGYTGENATQFTGSNGNWNDLFDNGARGGTDKLNYYIRETTINSAPLSINAGSGNVTFEKAVGTGKALANLAVTGNQVTFNDALKLDSTGASITNAGTGSIAGVVSGTGALAKNGAGTLNLSAANTYTGATTISAGTLVLQNNAPSTGTSSFGGSGALRIESIANSFSGAFSTSGWTFRSDLGSLTIGKTTNTKDITVAGGYGASIAGPISIYGGAVTLNAGLTTTNATTGDISIQTTGLGGSGNIALASERGLTVTQSGDSIYQGAISGTGATLTKNGAGRLSLLNASSYNGGTTLSAGGLGLYNNTALGTGALTLAGGTSLLLGRAVTEIANDISLTGTASIGLDTNVDYLIIGGGGGAGNAYDYGAGGGGGAGGMLVGTTSFSGGTGVSVTVGSGGAGGSAVSSPTSGSNGGNSSVGALVALGGGGGGGSRSNGLNGGSGGGAGGRPGSQNLSGGSGTQGQGYAGGNEVNAGGGAGGGGAGGAGANTTSNSGGTGGAGLASTITGQSVTYAAGGAGGGGYPDGTGLQQAGASAAANLGNGGGGASSNAQAASAGGTGGSGIVIVRYMGATAGSGSTVSSGSGTAAGYTLHTFTTTGSSTLTLNALNPVLKGVISGTGALTVNATDGTVTLAGRNTYSGGSTITGGTVKVGAGSTSGTLGTGAITNNAALIFNRSDALTFANAISGTGTLTQQGGGTLTLTGSNSYSGFTTINSNTTLQIGSGDTSGTLGSGVVTDNGTLVFNRSDDVTVANAIGGTGSLTQKGSGVLTLTANETYSGATHIDAGTLVLQNNAPTKSTSGFNGPGALRIESASDDFSNAFSTSGWNFGSNLSGLTIGKAKSADGTSDVAVTIPTAINIAGPISIYGGAIAINAALTATGSTLTLKSSGNVTQGAALTAANLQILGGNVMLDNAGNAIGTLAASGVGSLTYVDKDALTIGTVGTTDGVSASGAISVGTKTSNLTVTQNVGTTNASNSALVLNAGIDTAVGSSTGGNIVIDGTLTVSVGSGGRATLFSGSISGSTGLNNLSGLTAGTGRFRYNADETTDFTSGSWTALSTGLYAIYREQPSAAVTVAYKSMTYGDAVPTLTGTVTGALNGDSAHYAIHSRVNSTSDNIKAGAYSLTEDCLAALGYNVSVTTGTLTVAQKALLLTGLLASDKTYHRDVTATVSSYGSLSGLMGSDVASLVSASASAAFGDWNAGANKTVIVSSLSLSGSDSANYSIGSQTTTATINKATLTLAAVTDTKVYDATPTSTGTVSVTGLVAGDSITGTLSQSFDSKNVMGANGSLLKVTSGYAVSDDNSGNNYTVTTTTAQGTITPKTLTLTGFIAGNKVYDGSTTATILNAGSLTGVVDADVVTVSNSGATFNSKDVLTANSVTLNGVMLSGPNVGNYSFTTTAVTDSASIMRKTLSISGLVANNTTYNGTTAASISDWGSVSTDVGTETLTLNHGSASFDSANAGAGKTVTSIGYSLADHTGGLASNYQLAATSLTTLANVDKAALSISADNLTKTYDGGTSAAGTATVVSGTLYANASNGNTQDNLSGGSFVFTDKNAGTNKTVTVTGVAVNDGNNGDNYAITYVDNTTSTINQAALTVTANVVTKTYDGNTSATGTGTVGTLAGAGEAVNAAGMQVFLDKNVGTSKTVRASGVTIKDSADADVTGNYAITYVDNTTSTITAKSITLNAPASSRDYDGQTTYTASSGDLAALSAALGVTGDSVSGITLTYTDKNVATGKTLTASGAVVADGNSGGNYIISYAANKQSSILRLNSVTWTGGGDGSSWFDPTNWAATNNLALTGVVPDRANVATVVIPSRHTVNFNGTGSGLADASSPVSLMGLQGSGAILNVSTGTLNLGGDGGSLSGFAQTGGALTSTGAFTITDSFRQTDGTLSGTGADSHIGITQTSGDLSWNSISSGGNLTVSSLYSIAFGTTGVGGNLFSSTRSGVTQTGPVTVTGSSTFVADTDKDQNAMLDNAANDFMGAVSFTNANSGNWKGITIVDGAGDLTLGDVTATGKLTAESKDGSIKQVDGSKITVDGTSDFTAKNDITLDGSNDFKDTLNAEGKDITLNDANDLMLGVITATGKLDATAADNLAIDGTVSANSLALEATNGNISEGTDGTLTVLSGPTDLIVGGDITLNKANDFNGTVNAEGKDITLNDVNALTLGDTNATGKLDTTAGGEITQDNTSPNKIVVGGDTTLNSTTGEIKLDGTNDFKGSVNVEGTNITLNDTNDLTLGDITATGKLDATATNDLELNGNVTADSLIADSGGNISQGNTGQIEVSGQTDLTAGDSITLDGKLTTGDATLNATNDVTLNGNVTAETLTADAGGSISEGTSGKLNVIGQTDLTATTGNITLGGANDFNGTVNAEGKDITLKDVNALSLGDITATGNLDATTVNDLTVNGSVNANTLALDSTSGNISEGTDGTLTVLSGPTDLIAGGDITLDKANDFNGTVNAKGKDIKLNDANDLTLGDITATGKLDATAADNLAIDRTVSADSLALEATNGNISEGTDGTLTVVTGPTYLIASGDITLGGANDFNGAVDAEGVNITLNDENNLTLGNVTTTGKLDATAATDLALNGAVNVASLDLEAVSGDIYQGASSTLNVTAGPTDLKAGDDITLDKANDFNGTVNAEGKDVTLNDINRLTVVLDASGHSKPTAGGDLVVSGHTNDLTTSTTSGGSTSFGTTTVLGKLSTTSAGAVSQTGALSVAGTATFSAPDQDVSLDNPGNDFGGAVSGTASSLTLRDSNDLMLGTVTTTGQLTVQSNGTLSMGTTTVGGDLSASSGNGAMTQTGAINTVGLATFDAGSGVITLTNLDNRFPRGTKVIAASFVIAGDAQTESQDALEQVVGAMPTTTLPGVNAFSMAAPAPLVMTSVAPATSPSGSTSSTTANTDGGNSAGVSIDIGSAPANQAVLMAAVSLPKGTSTAGAGFSFELPETVRALAQTGSVAQATQSDGASLPAWLRFDAESLRFEAAAVPAGAFPLQMVLMIGGQRVLVVISERNT